MDYGIWVGDRGGKDDGLNDCIGGEVDANELGATERSLDKAAITW